MLRRRGRVEIRDGQLHMTDDGRWRAARLVRGHRLWEAYLVKHLGLPPTTSTPRPTASSTSSINRSAKNCKKRSTTRSEIRTAAIFPSQTVN